MTVERNKAAIRRLVDEVFNGRNVGAIDEMLAPDFVEHEELPPGLPQGREGVKALTTMLHTAFPDFKATIDDLVAEGDKVTVRMTWRGTHHGDFMGIPPTGRPVAFGVIDILRMHDGRLAEHWGIMDQMALMQQLGVAGGPG